tara:strand:+ start:15642 stop:16997 length:1356 start_codon:yes stop_codon:yes gene_type:complete
MSVFKDIPSEDVSITTYLSHKNWEISSSVASSSYGVLTFLARSGSFGKAENYTAQGTTNTYYNKLVWDSINHQFYNPHRITPEFLGVGQASASGQGDLEYLDGFLPNTVTFLQESASVLSIPQQLYGDEIKKGSLSLESGSVTLSDVDGKIMSASIEVGDIFYKRGMVVITHPSASVQDTLNTYNLRFKASHPITQREYTCRIMDNEYNHTFNPTARNIDNFVRTRDDSHVTAGTKIDLDLATPIFGTTIFGDSGSINNIGERTAIGDLSLQTSSGSTSLKIATTGNSTAFFIPFNTTYNDAAAFPNTKETHYALRFNYAYGSGSFKVRLISKSGGPVDTLLTLTGSNNGNEITTTFTSSENHLSSIRFVPQQSGSYGLIDNVKLEEITPNSTQERSEKLKGFTSSSTWTPYITSVGLYNPSNELLAVGKLAIPTKKSMDYDISIVVRFDL